MKIDGQIPKMPVQDKNVHKDKSTIPAESKKSERLEKTDTKNFSVNKIREKIDAEPSRSESEHHQQTAQKPQVPQAMGDLVGVCREARERDLAQPTPIVMEDERVGHEKDNQQHRPQSAPEPNHQQKPPNQQ